MRSVNIHEAKTHLSRLVEAASKGEGFIIARAGKPLVKVVPLGDASRRAGGREGSGPADAGDGLGPASPATGIEAASPGDGPGPDASRRIGFMTGRITVPDDFDGFGREEIAAMFGLDD